MHFTQSAARFELLSVENGKKSAKIPETDRTLREQRQNSVVFTRSTKNAA